MISRAAYGRPRTMGSRGNLSTVKFNLEGERCSRPKIKLCNLPLFALIFIRRGTGENITVTLVFQSHDPLKTTNSFSRRCYLSAFRYTINAIATIIKSYVLNVLNHFPSFLLACICKESASLPNSF
ncbi:hypothetical protein BH18THE2_BH18THE2_03880 [soil metagenome]